MARFKPIRIVAALCLFASLAIAISPVIAQTKTLKLSHVTPPSHGWHLVAERIGETLERSSKGDYKLRVIPLGKLGRDPLMISLLRNGALELAVLTAGELSNRVTAFSGWFLPYLFEDVAAAGAAARLPAAKEMLRRLEDQGLVGLGYTFAGQRHVLSAVPLSSPEDLNNKKIRSFPNRIFEDWWKAMGAAPTAMPLGEVAPSLMTNLLDAVDVDLEIVRGLKLYEQASHLALTNHMTFPGVIVASKKWFDGLSETDRAMIRRAASEAQAWGIDYQVANERKNLQALRAAGVTIDDIDIAEFQRVGAKIRNDYRSRTPLIDEFAREVGGQ